MGRLVAAWLAGDPAVDSVTGLDAAALVPPVPGVRFVRARLHQPEWLPLLEGLDAVIHLDGAAWPWRQRAVERSTVADGKAALGAFAAAGVPKVIVAQSAALYGYQPPGPVAESAPVRGYQAGAFARARAMLSDTLDVLAEAAHTTVFTRLRCGWICGPHHTGLARALAGGIACGAGRRLSVVHEDDLACAIRLALEKDLPGVYNVAAEGGITFRDAAALVGNPDPACVPPGWLALRAWWRGRVYGERIPPGFYRGLLLDVARITAAGWTPRYPPRETVLACMAAPTDERTTRS